MLRSIRNSLIIAICFSISIVASADECSDLAGQLKNSISDAITTQSLAEIAKAKLTVLSENHYQHYFWKMPHIYSFLKKRNELVSCLFSEISQDASDQQIQEVIEGKMNEIFYSPRRLGFGPLYEAVLSMNDNLVLVDAPIADFVGKPGETHVEWVTRRDTWMLERIKKAFADNECTGGIYNIGSQHTWDNFDGDLSYISFGTRAKKDINGTIIVEQIYDDRLSKCMMQIPSFVAPASDSTIKSLFGLETKKSSADYVLYLREIDIMHALTVQP